MQPLVGKEDKGLNLHHLPRVTSIITDIVNKEIENLVYPKML